MSHSLRPNIVDHNGVTLRWCPKCDTYKTLDNGNFQIQRRKGQKRKQISNDYWSRTCRECLRLERNLKQGNRYPLAQYRRYIDWMVGVVGWNETVRRIGISRGTLFYWHGNAMSNGKVIRRITTPSARKIILAVAQLRYDLDAGTVTPITENHAKGHCRGCGVMTDSDDYTDGCRACKDRKAKRKLRAEPGSHYLAYEAERARLRRKQTRVAA